MDKGKVVQWRQELPVRHDVDVFVAGGGPAGIAAAVAAARQGAQVFLAEGQACFGGMGTSGLVPVFMQFADGVNFLAAGIGREIYDALWDSGAAYPADQRDNPNRTANIRAEALKRLYDRLVAAAGVQFSFLTQVIGVEAEDGFVSHAVCAAKSGVFAVRAKLFVDATGDGDLAAWAGAPFEKGDAEGNLMPGTLCSLWAGVDWPAVYASKMCPQAYVPEGLKAGLLTVPDLHLPGMWQVGEQVGGGNIGHLFGVDGSDERSLTAALLHGRRSLLEYEQFFKKILKGYEKMELVATAALPGIRETRRILGDYLLNVEDFKARAVFPDEIGRYAYPVDVHPSKPDAANFKAFEEEFTRLRYQPGENYGIPYRCLTPQKLHNLLVAGRCLSADRLMQGSVRVMPACFITGQAAGTAAAMLAGGGGDIHTLDVAALQQRLKAAGAFLP
ncbi:MAG: FAD-dependent oxidoreductase [Lentisphaeria bacterium]|jgi:hypothetical protein